MRIGINTLFLIPNKVGGTETYARGLLSGLGEVCGQDEYIVYCNKENYSTFIFNSRFRKILSPFKATVRPLRIIWEQFILPLQLWSDKVDVLLSLGYICPLFVPCKSIVVIFDLNWFFHPEEFSFLSRFFWKTLVTFSANRADKIITSSINSKKDIMHVLGISDEKIEVVYGGVDRKHFKQTTDKKVLSGIKKKYKMTDRFILTVSAAYKFKNLSKFIDAFNSLNKKIPDLQLLIIGLGGRGKQEALDKIGNYSLENKVIIAGWVPEMDIPYLYSAAQVYVHPSLYEGFGFPVLEAMSCGCPVVSSKSASLPELVGKAGVVVDANNAQDIAEGIKKIIDNCTIRSEFVKNGLARSKNFNWLDAAIKTKVIIKESIF